MAKITVEGLDEYALRLSKLFADSEELTKEAVYAGADVVADSIKQGLKSIPTENGYGSPSHKLRGCTARQKSDLIKAFGLAPMENDGDYIQTKAGFDGYGSTKTKKYPKGVPNAMLMRSIESGTSFRQKTPVIRRAVNKSKEAAQEAMGKAIDEAVEKMMK